jgi:mRNA-degrading endonuclease YafQ of YafQ-DinJ toxin-antitoxin module
LIHHPLIRYSSQNPDHKHWAYAVIALAGYFAFFYKKGRKLLSNPREYDYYTNYFKEAIELNSAYEKAAREAFNYIREHTLRDDQVALLMQMRRSRLYCEIILTDRGQQLHINKLQKLLRVIINDTQKFTSNDNRTNRLRHASKDFFSYGDESEISGWGNLSVELRHYINVLNHTMARLFHYLDLMWGQKARYGSLQKFSWNRNALELLTLLEKEEAKIHDNLAGLESFTATPIDSEVFLEISPKLRWEIIYDNFCPFEQEAMGHCATARSGCYLLSLREKTRYWERWDSTQQKFITKDLKKEVWLPKVTATVCPLHLDVNSEYYGSKKPKYVILDILGPKNKAIDKKWYEAAEILFEDPRIVKEEERQVDKAFTTKDLSIEKRESLYKKKPSLAPSSWQIEKANLRQLRSMWLEKIVKPYTRRKSSVGDDTSFMEKDLRITGKTFILIKGDYLSEFLEKLSKVSSRYLEESLNEVIKTIEEGLEIDFSYDRHELQNNFEYLYEHHMTNEQKSKFKKLVEDETGESLDDYDRKEWSLIENLDVAQAFTDAYYTGWEVGSHNSAYHAYKYALDGAEIISEQGLTSLLLKKEKNGKWYGYLGEKELRAILIDQDKFGTDLESIFYSTHLYENDSRKGHFGSIRWEYDFDYDAAAERFKEEIDGYLK